MYGKDTAHNEFGTKEIVTAFFVVTDKSWVFLHDIGNCLKYVMDKEELDLRVAMSELKDDCDFRVDETAIYLKNPAEKKAFFNRANVSPELIRMIERQLGKR